LIVERIRVYKQSSWVLNSYNTTSVSHFRGCC